MLDLRSDTLTTPDEGMRAAMAAAPVGDDVYAEDPTTNALQDRVAELFGFEAALFVPSGTQGNQICIALHTGTGGEVIAEKDAHIFHYENAATSVIARGQIHAVPSEAGMMPIDEIRAAVRPKAYYYPPTSMVAVENTHNRHGGTVLDFEYLIELRALCSDLGLPLHCDGARIWNAMAASAISAKAYGALFDTMSVCLSKGLGAPVGSVILGTHEKIRQAWRWRKMIGGGMRQTGILAAAGMYALDHVLPHLHEDHAKAQLFAQIVSAHPSVEIDLRRVQTNIVMFAVPMDDQDFVRDMTFRGIRVAPIKPGWMRVVFYHQITMEEAEAAAAAVHDVLGDTSYL